MILGLITASYGDHAPPYPVDPTGWLDAVLVSDRPLQVEGWRTVVHPQPLLHPRLAAKLPKVAPWEFLSPDVDGSLWIDASMRLTSDAHSTVTGHLWQSQVAQFPHPERSCIYQEGPPAAALERYDNRALQAQLEHYRSIRFPENYGLWANGCMARIHTERVMNACAHWLGEILRWSWHDQLSWPVICREHNLHPAPLPGTLWDNMIMSLEYR